jgi:hypothetical protein
MNIVFNLEKDGAHRCSLSLSPANTHAPQNVFSIDTMCSLTRLAQKRCSQMLSLPQTNMPKVVGVGLMCICTPPIRRSLMYPAVYLLRVCVCVCVYVCVSALFLILTRCEMICLPFSFFFCLPALQCFCTSRSFWLCFSKKKNYCDISLASPPPT